VIVCANCGADNATGQKFCGECGSQLVATCPSCGATNAPGQKFCGECGTPLSTTAAIAAPATATPSPEAAAQRRLVTVLFADLVGFTPLSESRDAEEVRELLSRYFDTCRRLIDVYGGTVEKFIGDAVMAVWGTPVATEDDAERAVRAGLDLVAAVSALGDEIGAPDLRARAGVLTGEAAVTVGATGEGMVAGDLVNTASRIQTVAAPGSVLVGDATRRASEHAVAYADAGEHELKGKDQPARLWRALRVVSARRGELKAEGLEAPFVGRDRELRQIKDLFHSCAEQRKAHLVSVTGIAGIGKSRLAWEFYKYFDGIVETVLWHRGRCLAYGEGVTYWALADMVRMRCQIAEDDAPAAALEKLRATLSEHLLDDEERRFVEPRLAQLVGAADADVGDRQELFAAWRLFFERLADSYPVLLIFEDLQWADASLLDFIEYLLEWSRNQRLYVITLARPELLEKRPTWGAGQRSFTSIYLEPLSQNAMRELLHGLVPGLPEALEEQILARAEGVPLYAVETVRMLLDRGLLTREGQVYRVVGEVETLEVPETLHALIAARLDGLSDDERRLLQNGAVLGKTFTRATLAALAGVDEAQLDRLLTSLVRKEVLSLQADPRSPEHGQYGFLQDLVRRVAYETLGKRDRKSRHLAAAEQLGAAFGEDEVAEVIASHLVAAYQLDPDADDAAALRGRAAEALVRAGDRAAALAAAAEAQHYFEQAAELVEDERMRADLAHRAGEMAWAANDPTAARALLERAHAEFGRLGDPTAAARVSRRLAVIDFVEGHPPRAIARLEPALHALEESGAQEEIAAVAAQLARVLFFNGENDRALPHLERALTLAEALEQTETFAEALNTKAILLAQLHRRREGNILLQGALAIALEHGFNAAALRAYNNLGAGLWVGGQFRAMLENHERGLALARRIGDRQWESNFSCGIPGVLMMLGQWDETLERAAEAERGAVTEFVRGLLMFIAPVYLARGELDRAREILVKDAGIAHSESADFASGYALTQALVAAAENQHHDALASVERALENRDRWAGGEAAYRFQALEAVGASVNEEKLRELLAIVDELYAAEMADFLRAQRARFRARLPECDADAELATAERLFAGSEMPFYVAVTQLEHAEWLLAHDRAAEAEPLRAEARETFEALRAAPWLARADALVSPAQRVAAPAG
jgi:class 3 adenylate cyclase/tetratricopeptide (TPR) repeat protein